MANSINTRARGVTTTCPCPTRPPSPVSMSWSAKSSETPSSSSVLRPLLEQPVGLAAQARYLGALVITERRGIGEARCLVQQQRGAPLHEARAIADGVGQVPQPRVRGRVERREADGLQDKFSRRASRHRLPWSCGFHGGPGGSAPGGSTRWGSARGGGLKTAW